MAYDGNGNYTVPPGTAAVTGALISSTAYNALLADLQTALTKSFTRDGQSAALANLPMGGFKLTGLGAGVNPTDSVRMDQLVAGSLSYTPADGKPGTTTLNARLQLIDGTSAVATTADGSDGGYGLAPGANVNIWRDGGSLSGGTFGHVNSAILAKTKSGATEDAFEWTALFALDNYANTSAQNVAVYAKANRYGTSPVFAGCFEFRDYTGNANPISGCIGMEVDIFANGTDSGFNRVGIDVTGGKGIVGLACSVGHGIRVGGAVGEVWYQNGITIGAGVGGDSGAGTDEMRTALAISTTGTWGINMTGTQTVGIDMSGSVHSSAALRIAANEYIALEATGAIKYKYNSGNGFLEFFQGSTRRGYIDMLSGADGVLGGGVALTGAQTIAGIKTFSNYINATGGIICGTAGAIFQSDVNIDPSMTVNFSSSGNLRAKSGSATNQIRIKIDSTSYYLDVYS